MENSLLNRDIWSFNCQGTREKIQIITPAGKINGEVLAVVYQRASIISSCSNDVSNSILNEVTCLNDRPWSLISLVQDTEAEFMEEVKFTALQHKRLLDNTQILH